MPGIGKNTRRLVTYVTSERDEAIGTTAKQSGKSKSQMADILLGEALEGRKRRSNHDKYFDSEGKRAAENCRLGIKEETK